jgi:hypothetical protein
MQISPQSSLTISEIALVFGSVNDISEQEASYYEVGSEQRKKELAVVSKLINEYLPNEKIIKDEHGKPFVESGKYYISVFSFR